jgi:peptidoglycan hydrolase-like protein with peptidoglycan-binding domain
VYTWVAVLVCSMLWLCPMVVEAGTTEAIGEQRPEQGQLINKGDLKLVQERLKAEGVYAGPVDGELNAQTEAALRDYQEKKGLPVSGAPDQATLRDLQIRPPASPGGDR